MSFSQLQLREFKTCHDLPSFSENGKEMEISLDKVTPANLVIFAPEDLFEKIKSMLHQLEMKHNFGEPQGHAFCGSLGNTNRVFVTRHLDCSANECICAETLGGVLKSLKPKAALVMSTLTVKKHGQQICIVKDVKFRVTREKGKSTVVNYKCNGYLANAFIDSADEMHDLTSRVQKYSLANVEEPGSINSSQDCVIDSTLCSGLYQTCEERGVPLLELRATRGRGSSEMADLVENLLKDKSVISKLMLSQHRMRKTSHNRPIQETEDPQESTTNPIEIGLDSLSIGQDVKAVCTQQTIARKLLIDCKLQITNVPPLHALHGGEHSRPNVLALLDEESATKVKYQLSSSPPRKVRKLSQGSKPLTHVQHTNEPVASDVQSYDGYQATAVPLTREIAQNQQGNRLSSEAETKPNGQSSSPPHPPPRVSKITQEVKPMLQVQRAKEPVETSPQCCENDESPAIEEEPGSPSSRPVLAQLNRQTDSTDSQISEEATGREFKPLAVKGESLTVRPPQTPQSNVRRRSNSDSNGTVRSRRKTRPMSAHVEDGSHGGVQTELDREANARKQQETTKKDDLTLPPINKRP